ncbi:MAG: xanthine phosphoribosyltransferase [Peptoanaerobacter stomatis]|uniref:xanthine phosphoribosyltransferase n=1 Tax=Peptoanaerobacter stomatis TaxID=796937 RepID=UPI003FA06D3E
MKLLEQKILSEGRVKEGNILKVDEFLNHKLDIAFLNEIGKEFKKIFADKKIDKILTIEASGIAIACIAAQYFDNVPVVFAKKAKSQNLDGDCYTSVVESFTYKKSFTITVAEKFLKKGEKILIIDDFLAEGKAVRGLIDVINQAGAIIEGVGIVIEKGFQTGGKDLRALGLNVQSLCIIESMENGKVQFREV